MLRSVLARPPVAAGARLRSKSRRVFAKGITMHDTCEYIKHCGFFRKYGERRSNVWRGLVSFYCQGRGFSLCERRSRYLNNVTNISDDILPSGQEVSKAFLSLN
jgi:hypothetical protein